MSDLKKTEVPAEIPARSRDGRDENPAESKRAWENFFARIEEAQNAYRGRDVNDEFIGEEAA